MASGGWGSMGAWGTPKQQQPQWQTAGDGGLIRTSASENSVADTASAASTAVPAATTARQAPIAAAQPASKSSSSTFNTLPNKPTVNLYNPAAVNDMAAKEAALARKEAELQAREKDLSSREADLRRAGALQPRKNWPILFPLIHHDIAGDIPQPMQHQVRLAYWCYLGLVVCLIYNFAGACAMVALKAPDRMSSWFLATIYCIAGIPLAMVLWYNKLYNTAANNGSLGYVGFFIGFSVHVAFSTWAAIAVPLAGDRWSFTGWVAALRAFDVSTAGGIMFIIGSSLWTIEALASYWCLKVVFSAFRSGGKQQEVHGELAKVALKAAMTAEHKV